MQVVAVRIRTCSLALSLLFVGFGTVGCSSSPTPGTDTNATKKPTATAGSKASTAGTPAAVGSSGTPASTSTAGMSATAPPSSGQGGSSGTTPSGTAGNTATAGHAAADMDAGPMDEDDAGVCIMPPRPLGTGGFKKCSADVCPAQDSVCLPNKFLMDLKIPTRSINMLADCDATNKCVPVTLAAQAGRQILPTCTSLIGAEGRCLSACVPQVSSQASLLPKDTCTGSDLCAPCYDPRTGAETGACTQGCDPGPTKPKKTFASCCSTRGLCVPPKLAGAQAPNLNKDTCTGDLLCAPSELADPAFKPKSCASLDDAEGRCVSTCIGGPVAKQKDRLPTAGCGQNEVCAPCFDPITGLDTGACSINGDKPSKPAYRFAPCCDNGAGTKVGVCVPPALAGDRASMLRQETCAAGRLCAPIKNAQDPNYKFPGCIGLGAGACVPSCILDPAEAGILSQVRCDKGEVCAPCDLLGTSTGACD